MGKKTKVGISPFVEAITGKMPEWNKNDDTLMETFGLSCCPGFRSDFLPMDTTEIEFTSIEVGDVFRTDEGKTATVVSISTEQRSILFCVKRSKRNTLTAAYIRSTFMAVSIEFAIEQFEKMHGKNDVPIF